MSVYEEPIEWLEESIKSILNQTFVDFEFIIILDNPNYEKGLAFLREMEKSDFRVKLILNKQNVGLTKSLNIGLKLAKGKYVARMDADDISYADRFQKQFDFMENNIETVASGSGIKRFGIQSNTSIFESDPDEISINFTCPSPFLSPIAHPTAFIRRDILVQNNIQYNENYRTAQDYGLWSELLFVGKLSNLKEVLLDYRTSENQITSKKRGDQLLVVNEIIKKHIEKWLSLNYPEYDSAPNLLNVKKVSRSVVSKSEVSRFRAFSYGLLLDSSYNAIDTFIYLLRNLNINIPLIDRLKLVIKKIIRR